MTRTYRTVRTLLAGYATAIVGMVLGLAVTPRIVRILGQDGYGAFQTALNYLLLLTPLQLGVASALQVTVARALGEGRPERTAALLRAAARLFARFGLLTVAASLILAVFAPVLIPTHPDLIDTLRWGFCVAGLQGVLLPLTIYRSLADARQRGHVTQLALFAQTVVVSFASLGLVSLGWDVTGMFAAVILGSLMFSIVIMRDGRTMAPPSAALSGPVDPEAAADLKQLNVWSILTSLISQICLSSDKIVIALVAGTAVVTPFTLTLRLPGLAALQLAAIGGSAWAALAELYHQNRLDRMNARLVQLTRVTAFLGLAVLVPIAIFNGRFVSAWVGPENDAGWPITLLGVANAWMLSVVSLWAWVINGMGRVREVLPPLLVGTAVNLAGSLIATIHYGPIGPLVGTAAQLFGVSSWWLPQLLRYHFGTRRRDLAGAALGPLALAVPVTIALHFTFRFFSIDDPELPRLARIGIVGAGMSVVAVLYLVLGWFTVLPRADRAELMERLMRRRGDAPS
jgi:O-antigen/teichoic acid export membrane protein